MIIAVTGGRDYTNYQLVNAILADLRPTLVIHGSAKGADTLCALGAVILGIPTEPHPANWDKHGKAAGPIRNQEMIDRHPDLLVAFPGGVGTADMVKRALKAGVPVLFAEEQ